LNIQRFNLLVSRVKIFDDLVVHILAKEAPATRSQPITADLPTLATSSLFNVFKE
jgi:hypothetical protein